MKVTTRVLKWFKGLRTTSTVDVKDLIYLASSSRDWRATPDGGIIVKRGNEFFLNGSKYLFECICEKWWTHSQGVVCNRGEQFFLDGKELELIGEYDVNSPVYGEIVVQKDEKFFLYRLPDQQY